MILKCIAVDDELLALNKIKRFISKIDFIELVQVFDNAYDAINYLKKDSIDIIFLDVEMPEMSGFDFLKELTKPPFIVMTTAFEQYALKSYDFDVVDYLLKPLQFDRFLMSVEKVYKLLQPASSSIKKAKEAQYLFVKSSGNIVRIPMEDILYVEGMKDYLAIHFNQQRVLTLMNFQDLLEKLPANEFMRTHKSFIVNKSKIDQIKTGELIIKGQSIPVSRTYKPQVNKLKDDLI
ncbi:MAG: LytTR family DNA-binding domain-containing protein [Bacteroidetes bacterium]|nr:LytTR family DNA-binding domain-containing protein [Bacteroidota bacterium]